MSNMRLIMENWRKFADNANSFDKSKILVETKIYTNDLQTLIFEHRTGKISTEHFSAVLSESIIAEQNYYLNEGLMDLIKGGIEKVNDFLTMQFIKLQTLISTSAVNAARGIGGLGQIIGKIKQQFPSLYEVGKVVLMALAVYAAYKFMISDAQADVLIDNPMASLGDAPKIKYDPKTGKAVAGMLKIMAQQDPEFSSTADMIIKDIASGKTIDASSIEGYQEVLGEVRGKLMRVMTGGKAQERFAGLIEIGEKALDKAADQLQDAGKQLSTATGADGATVTQAAGQSLTSLSRKAAQNQDIVKDVLDGWMKEFGKVPEPQSLKGFARRVLEKALSPEQFKKYLESNADLKLTSLGQEAAKTIQKLK